MSQPRATGAGRITRRVPALLATVSILLSATYAGGFAVIQREPSGRAPSDFCPVPPPEARAAWVPPGFKVEVAVKDLEYPTSVEFDDSGNMYIAEAGYFYGDPVGRARVLKVTPSGDISVVADQLRGPVNDLLWYQGRLFISQRGKISYLAGKKQVVDVVTGLPSLGDHYNNQMTVGPDGRIYFGVGSATNSGVVGLDNLKYLWLHLYPDVHDYSPYDLCLQGVQYPTANPLFVFTKKDPPWAPHLLVQTSPFHAFGDTGGIVKGVGAKANSTLLALDPSQPDGCNLEVYAWGFRNPYGAVWSPSGQLYVSDHGYDERGSRPIANAPDMIFRVRQNGWYGFPDYAGGCLVTEPQFRSDRGPAPKLLLRDHPPVEMPLTTQAPHSAVAKMDVSRGRGFGNTGDIFIAQFGSAAPVTGEDVSSAELASTAIPQVIRLDPATGGKESFFRLRDGFSGPPEASYASPGPRHPVEAYLTRSGDALYISDISAAAIVPTGIGYAPYPFPGTGVIWRVTRTGSGAQSPPANLSANP